jgi:hypothetical protein
MRLAEQGKSSTAEVEKRDKLIAQLEEFKPLLTGSEFGFNYFLISNLTFKRKQNRSDKRSSSSIQSDNHDKGRAIQFRNINQKTYFAIVPRSKDFTR